MNSRFSAGGSLLRVAALTLWMVVMAVALSRGSAAADEFREALEERGPFSCLSQKEARLLKLVNDYRAYYGMRRIANSRSLNKVARLHAMDLAEHGAGEGSDSRGLPCNMHSWSDRGFWTPFCYTDDQFYKNLMWKKPQEITNNVYDDVAYENTYWTSADEALPVRVLESWKKSPPHKSLMLETGKWAGSNWGAIGVGVYKNVAVVWLGTMADPLGPMKACR